MLKQLRSGAAGFLAKLLLALLVLMFIFWGVHGSVNLSDEDWVAKVGDQKISQSQFEREVTNLRRSIGEQLPQGKEGLTDLYRRALANMIDNRLTMMEAERLGLSVSDDTLARQIGNDPAFKNPSGEFDKVIYQQTLREKNLSEGEYLDHLRSGLVIELLLKVLDGAELAPRGEAQLLYAITGETRQVDLAMIRTSPDYHLREPLPAQTQSYYDVHKADYMAPEFRTLEIVRISPQSVLGRVEISRQELFDRYHEHLDSLMLPEKRDVFQLLYSSKAEAENAYGMLRSGKSFKEAAQLLPPTNKDSLDLGYVTKDQLPAGADAVYSLTKDEFTQPIESPFGWHIFFVKDIKEKHATPFDEVRKSLEAELRQQKGEALLTETTERLEDAIAGTPTLEAAAKQAGLPLIHTDPLNRAGLGSDNHPVLQSATDKAVLETAFALQKGETSELKRQADGGEYVVKVNAVTPSRQRTLDEVRGQVEAAWKAQDQQGATHDFANRLVARLRAAGDPSAAEKILISAKVEITRGIGLKRNGSVIGASQVQIPPAMVNDIFARKAGEPTAAHRYDNQGFVIALVTRIDPAPEPSQSQANDPAGEQSQAVDRALRKDYDNEIFEQYIEHLKSRFPVSINDRLLGSLIERQ